MGLLGDIFNPGGEDRDRAGRTSKSNQQDWYKLRQMYDDTGMSPEQMAFSNDPLNTDPGTIHAYSDGPMEQAVTERSLDEGGARAAGLQGMSSFDPRFSDGGSNWAVESSAFDERDPSAYGDLGPSAYEGLSYSDDALGRMESGGDYFENLSSGGSDPIAEAQYARKVAEAEGSRKANTDAALAAEETRGAGSGSGRLLAELSNQQAGVSDQYLAGMDANALAASRRDNAAGEGARIGQMIGSEQAAFDTTRAGGLDTDARGRAEGLDTYSNQNAAGRDQFAGDRAAGMDTYTQNTRAGMDDWAQQRYADYYGASERNADRRQGVNTRNTGRQQSVGDENTALWNTNQAYNDTQKQQDFQNRLNLQQGVHSGNLGLAGVYQGNADGATDWGGRVLAAGGQVATAAASRPKTNGG